MLTRNSSNMGKVSKVIVCGMKSVGKTAILEQVIYGRISDKYLHSTIEDIYVANIESDRGIKERVRFYDTAGIENSQTFTANGTTNQQLPRHYLTLADGYILVYETEKHNSVDVLISIKNDIDKNKDKKEVAIIVIGNKTKENSDIEAAVVSKAAAWCAREKIKHFTVSALNRPTLFDPFVYITSKLNPPPSKSTFTPLSMGRKVLKDSA